jgi:CHAT domain-containing protein
MSRLTAALPFLLLEGVLAALQPTAAPKMPPGIVLYEIRHGSTADQAGLLPGDVVLAWGRDAANGHTEGELQEPFDWTQVFIEQVPRGTVTLRGLHGQQEKVWILPGGAPSAWQEAKVRPLLPDDLRALFEQGQKRVAAGAPDAALALWRAAAEAAAARGESISSRWFSILAARILARTGRIEEAEVQYSDLVSGLERSPEGRTAAAQMLREWGDFLRDRQLWERAESCYQRALALDRQASSDSLAAAWSLTGLGYTASWSAGEKDPDTFFREALAVRERWAPGSADIATTWWDRGNDAMSNRDPRTARERFARAVELEEKATSNGLYIAEEITSLGGALFDLGDFTAAEALWNRALRLAEERAPDDFLMAGILQDLGEAAMNNQNWPEAERFLQRSLTPDRGLTQNPIAHSDILHDLGTVERRLGKRADSARDLCRSMEIVEQQRERFDRTQDVRRRWGFVFADQYRDCARSLVDTGEVRRAFEVLERGRARSFLDQLTDRSRRVANLLRSEAAEWLRLGDDYDRTQEALDAASARKPADPRRTLSLKGRQREILRRREQILASRRPSIPARYPEPLDLGGVGQILDAGTALLLYATSEDQTLLFVVKPASANGPRLEVFTLPLGGEALSQEVALFREALVDDRFDVRNLQARGRRLYDLLLRPAERLLADAARLLIVPDGPLHTLPFAALVRDGRYLAEWKPLHFALSATSYAEIKKRRQPAGDPARWRLVAFGDPRYPRQPNGEPGVVANPALRKAARGGLSSLPQSRREVAEVARLFPLSRVYLQDEATEERARQLGGDVDLLHFAVHGLLDTRTPANSALALSPPPKRGPGHGNGLLQAWEITEDLHLNAALVTLSACDTALGRDMGGEGLIGLTRAFQSAGARSVLATLWEVSDRRSAALMPSFYRALRAGKPKDEALREAQIRQIHSQDAPEPFYWAAYQLYGDWQ